jgi:DNA-binding LytR/AlgR family response regulator
MIENEKYNCIVIDDEYLARKLMTDYISKVPQFNLIGVFDSPVNAFNALLKEAVHVVFLDIEMQDMTGIDFVKNLPLMPNRPIIVFVTAYPQYAVEGFEINAVEYLLKPVSFPRFMKAVNKVTTILNIKGKIQSIEDKQAVNKNSDVGTKDHIIIKTERKIIKLHYEEILFIEGALEYVNFQTVSKKIMGLFSLKKLEKELPPEKFLRIHRSYIVALDKIHEINGNKVIVGKWTIYVSKAMRSQLLQNFSS